MFVGLGDRKANTKDGPSGGIAHYFGPFPIILSDSILAIRLAAVGVSARLVVRPVFLRPALAGGTKHTPLRNANYRNTTSLQGDSSVNTNVLGVFTLETSEVASS